MANRRMFSKSITNSSRFLMMPQSAQNLYFHFGMNADDDGFCEHFSIMRMTDSKPDDLKVLQAKGLVRVFDDQILIITEWKENNYIRSDRYEPSKYLEIYKEELKLLASNNNISDNNISGIPNGNQMATQGRLGKVRIDNHFDLSKCFCEAIKSNNKQLCMTLLQDDDIQIESVDDNGEPIKARRKGKPLNKSAFYLQKVFLASAKKELGVVPLWNKAGYFMLVRLLKKGLTIEQLEQAIKDWFNEPKSDEDLVQITQCLSDNRINRFKIQNK